MAVEAIDQTFDNLSARTAVLMVVLATWLVMLEEFGRSGEEDALSSLRQG